MTQRHGVRLNWVGDDTIYVAQTIKSGTAQNAPYRIERRSDGRSKEAFVKYNDDEGLLKAIKNALNGEM